MKPVPFKWVFNSKSESDGLIRLKLRNIVKGYMQVPGVEFTESFSTFASDTSTRILIGLTLYYEDYGWIVELCDIEVAFLYPNTEVDMYIEWPEGILYLGIITKEFLEEYCILLGNLMYGNVDAAILWIRLLANYLVNNVT